MSLKPGVTLRDLINEATKPGLALPYAPYWRGVTVGGMIETRAQGSSLWGVGSVVHAYVVGLRIVTLTGPEDGYAKVWTLNNGGPDLNSAIVSLGVL